MPHQSHDRKSNNVKVPRKGTKPKSKRGRGKHPKIEEEFHNLRRKRYPDKDITKALCDNARSDVTRHLSKEEIQKLRRPLKLFGEDRSKIRHELQAWFKILDKAFFFGALSRCLKPIKVHTSYTDWRLGQYDWITKRIRINTDQGEYADEGCATEGYISTVLHECVHAILHEYSCRCRKCWKRRPSKRGGVGTTGHGAAWANAMAIIEASLQKLVSWRVDCGVPEGVGEEMRAKRWQPRQEQFTRWRMNYVDVDEMPPPRRGGLIEMRPMCEVM